LLKLKRSFSQLRLNSVSKQQPDVTEPGQQPPPLPSPKSSTDTRGTRPTSPSTSSPTPPLPVLKAPPSSSEPFSPPSAPDTSLTSNTAPTTTSTISHPHFYHPNIPVSGALAPMSAPKPVPSHSGGLHRRTPGQSPKLNLPPVNYRISLTIPPALTTDTGSARLSPTVISRPMPLPLLNLPTLTPRADSLKATVASIARGTTSAVGISGSAAGGLAFPSRDVGKQKAKAQAQKDEDRRVGKQHLKSMPALPMQGTGRGVKGHEEVDDMEDDDESVDDDDDLDEGESSRSDFLAPNMSVDSMRSSFDSSMSSTSSIGLDHLSPPSTSNGATQLRVGEGERTPSTGSSYHSALSGITPHHPPAAPDFTGLGVGGVPLLKQPKPPRTYVTE
jgi:hypothetical protein